MANTYFVKKDWIFNLESAYEQIKVIEIDIEEGNMDFPFIILGKQINDFDDLEALADEVGNLGWIAKTRKVTGKEYGRIKEIVAWRVEVRYMTCLKNGMNERDAGRCFEDL